MEGLREFEDDVGLDRTSVREVRLESLDGLNGSYSEISDRILLDNALSPSALPRVLRHELCHALDADEGLVQGARSLFDTLADELFASSGAPDVDGALDRKQEAFALFCEAGPLSAQALAEPCAADPGGIDVVATWLSAEVWQGYSIDSLTSSPMLAGSVETNAADGFIVYSNYDEPIIQVAFFTGDLLTEVGVLEYALIDLSGTSNTDTEEWPGVELVRGGRPVPPAGPIDVTYSWGGDPVGWEEGAAAARGMAQVDFWGVSAPRLFIWDAAFQVWRFVESTCSVADVPGLEQLFVANSRVWTASLESGLFSWAELPDLSR